MPRKKKPPLSFVEQMKKLRSASLAPRERMEPVITEEEDFSLESRVRTLLGIVERQKKNRDRMLFFVMYDIESNKVRALVENIAQMVPPYRSVGTARSGSVVPLISV